MCTGERTKEEGGRDSQADSSLSTEPVVRLDLGTPRSGLEPKLSVQHLSECDTQAPSPPKYLLSKMYN